MRDPIIFFLLQDIWSDDFRYCQSEYFCCWIKGEWFFNRIDFQINFLNFVSYVFCQDLDVSKVKVPVVGGHSGITILPLLSQVYLCRPKYRFVPFPKIPWFCFKPVFFLPYSMQFLIHVHLIHQMASCHNSHCFRSFQTQPKTSFTQAEIESLTDRIQNAGTEVVNAKAGAVSKSILLVHYVPLYCVALRFISHKITSCLHQINSVHRINS